MQRPTLNYVMLDEILGTVLQILIFSLIPILVYWIRNKNLKGFFRYVGLKPSTGKANLLAILACLLFAAPVLLLTAVSAEFQEIMYDPESLTGKFRQMGFGPSSVFLLLLIAIFKTAFAEELLFRGFIAKRLIAVTGFLNGNILQALLFGVIHTALFALITDNVFFLVLIFFVPSIGAYVSVYLNEKLAGGSIIPGWISHALANVLAYSVIGFLL